MITSTAWIKYTIRFKDGIDERVRSWGITNVAQNEIDALTLFKQEFTDIVEIISIREERDVTTVRTF